MGAHVGCFPIRLGLPRTAVGSASTSSLSRPARASRVLRPAGSLNRPTATFVTRLRPGRLPDQAARQLPDQPTILWMEPTSTGVTRLRGALLSKKFLRPIIAESPDPIRSGIIVPRGTQPPFFDSIGHEQPRRFAAGAEGMPPKAAGPPHLGRGRDRAVRGRLSDRHDACRFGRNCTVARFSTTFLAASERQRGHPHLQRAKRMLDRLAAFIGSNVDRRQSDEHRITANRSERRPRAC